jgi:hypothetical protein
MASGFHLIPPVKPGTRVRFPLVDAHGVLLLAQGAEVSGRMYALLRTRGITLDLHATLKVVEGEPAGLEIPLRGGRLLIGRREDCDVQLPGAAVSGHHCWVQKRGSGVFLQDLRSSNGTGLNSRRLRGDEAELADGDRVRVGGAVFVVQLYAAVAAATAGGAEALRAWHLEESAARRRAATPNGPTEPEIDLGAW